MDSPSTPARSHPQTNPRQLAVANVIFAGIAATLHVGKATIALPSLQRSFDGDLAVLSWTVSAFPFVGIFGGIATDLPVRRWGDRRLLTGGLAILGGANLLGAPMQDFTWLLATRFIEGLGFLIVVVTVPAVLRRITNEARRSVIFGLWSTFMTGGIALSMLFRPLLMDWCADWQLGALLVLVTALPLLLSVPTDSGRRVTDVRPVSLGTLLRVPAIILLALGFTTYNLQFFALVIFLPVFLIQRPDVALETAGLIDTAIVAANTLGNAATDFILSRGICPGALLATAAILMGVAGTAFFHTATPRFLAITLGFVFSAAAGMLPTAVLATASLASLTPSLTPLAISWVMQSNYLRQVTDPLLIGLIVSHFDWSGAIGLVLVTDATRAVLGLCLLRALDGLPRAIATGSAARPAS